MLNFFDLLSSIVPISIKQMVGKLLVRFFPGKRFLKPWKQRSEMKFWVTKFKAEGESPRTEYYRKFMMDMGNLKEQSFFDNLICVDIGCGPRGSLTWLTNARCAIGLDPLVERYMELGIASHQMIYILGSAEQMPFPSNYVDVVFSMNSLDHVDDILAACSEIRRVLKPGGYFIGSLNLGEPPTITEPFTLTEEFLEKHLFAGWEKEFYKIRPKVDDGGQVTYRFFYEDCPEELLRAPIPRALWCRLRVK